MEKDIKNTDPREVGTRGLEGLQWRPNSTEKKYSYDYTLENTPSLKEFLETPSGSPETKRRVSEGYSVGSMDTEGIYAPDLYDSKYDHEVKSINELENLEDFRAEKQPWYEKFGNGLAKMGILAKDTYLQTVGLGFTSMFSDVEGKESVWNNDLAEISYQNMKEMEKKFPNYYTEEEREAYATGKWTTMLDTANFWGDHFLKNLGFTIGAGAGAMFSPQGFAIRALGGIPKVGRFLSRALGTMFAAAGESNVEAYHAFKEFKESEFAKNSQAVEMELAKIRDKYSSQLNELSRTKQYALSMLNSNISDTERNKLLTLLSEIDTKERYLTESLEQDYINYENTLKGIERDIEERALSVGNTTWAANFALLSVTEFFSFGKLFDSGAMQRTIRFANNRAQDASKVGRRIAGQAIYDAVQEGPIEEMGQKLISESAKSAYSADSPDAYYEAYNNENAKIKIKNWQKGMIEGFQQSYGSAAAWEEGFIGAITGMMPGATSGITGGTSSDDTFLGKNKKVGLRGGLPGLIAEYVSTKNRNKKLVDRVNSLLEEYVDTDGKVKNALAAHLHFSEIMGGLSYTDDTFSFKNARDSSDFSLIQAMSEAGLVKNLDEMLNVDYSTLSDEELNNLAQQMGWKDVTVGNKKQSPIATKEGKEAFLKQLNQNKERMQEAYSNYKESVEFINSNPKLRDLSYDQKTQLAWLHFKERAINNRQKQINDSIRTSITAIQSHINDYISTNEASENKTTQERIKDYKKLKEIVENIIAGNPIEIKDKKEWISFLQKGNVQKALSYNNKSFKEGKEFIKGLRDLVLLENLKNEFKSSLDTYLKNPNTLVEETKKKEEKKQKEEEDKKKKEILNAANSASVSSLTDLDEEEEKTVSQIVGDAIDQDDPLGDAINMKLEEAKNAKKELKTLEDIKNAIIEGDAFSKDEIDEIEESFGLIQTVYSEAVDRKIKEEFEDVESPLWEEMLDTLNEVSGRSYSNSQKQLYQNIIDEFVKTQEFKNSLPTNSNTNPKTAATSGKDGSAAPALPAKRKGNKKEELRKDGNPFNEEDAEEERKKNQKAGGNKAEEIIQRDPDKTLHYWKTAITEYFLHLVKDKKTGKEVWVKFTEIIKNENKYSALNGEPLNIKYSAKEIHWIEKVTKYLEDKGCFSYIKNNNLKVGDKVTFFADLKFAKEKGLIVRDKDGNITDIPIFIKTGDQVIGVLPNKTFREKNAKQEYLDEWIADFLTQLNNNKKTDDSLTSFEGGRTEVAEVLAGHLPYIKDYRRITEEAFRQDDIKNMSIAIIGSNKDFILTDKGSNIKIRPYMGDKNPGKPFILMPIQSKEYTHMAVPMAMDAVNPVEGEVSLNGVLYDIINNLSGKESKLIFKTLNNIIFETLRVNFSKNGDISIELDEGNTRSTIYEGDPTDVSTIIESFKKANLHFNVLLNGNDTRTKNNFNSFSSITRDNNYNKLVLNTAKTNVGTSQENSDVMINSWYTLNPINDKGQQVTASRPEHQNTIVPKQKSKTTASKKDRDTVDNINQKAEKENNRKKSKTSKKEKNVNISQPQVDTVKPENDNTTSEKSTIEKIKDLLENKAGFNMEVFFNRNADFFNVLEEDIEKLHALLDEAKKRTAKNLKDLDTFSVEEFIEYLEGEIGKPRITTEGTKETIDVEKEKAWFKEVFPNLDEDRIITTIDNFIRIRGNKYAYGMYKRGMITLSKIGASGTLYHEAFHFVFDLFVSQEEKENIFDEARDKFQLRDYIRKEHEDLEIEEQLAEAFRRYVQFEETPIIGSLVHVFRQLKHFIQSFLGNEAYIDNLFYRINNAKIDTSEVQPSSSGARHNEIDLSFDREGFHGSFLDGLEFIGEGSESTIYRRGNKVIKISEPYYSDQFESRINNTLSIDSINNLNTRLIGFYYSQDSKGNKFKNPIFEQDFVEGKEATEEQIDKELKSRGFTKDTSGYTAKFVNNKTGVTISDVYSGNAFINNGKVIFVDADITIANTNNIGTYDASNDDIRYREVEGNDNSFESIKFLAKRDLDGILKQNAEKFWNTELLGNKKLSALVDKAKTIEDLEKVYEEIVENIKTKLLESSVFISNSRARNEVAAAQNTYPEEMRNIVKNLGIMYQEDASFYTDEELQAIVRPTAEMLTKERQKVSKEWIEAIKSLDPSEQFLVLHSITRYVTRENKEAIPIMYMEDAYKNTIKKYKESSSPTSFNFYVEYNKSILEEITDPSSNEAIHVSAEEGGGISGTWVKFNRGSVGNAEVTKNKLAAASIGTNWRTQHVEQGGRKVIEDDDHDFYAFIPSGFTHATMAIVPIKEDEGEEVLEQDVWYTGIFKQSNGSENEIDPQYYKVVDTLINKTEDSELKRTLELLGYEDIDSKREAEHRKKEEIKKFKERLENGEVLEEDIVTFNSLFDTNFYVIPSDTLKVGIDNTNVLYLFEKGDELGISQEAMEKFIDTHLAEVSDFIYITDFEDSLPSLRLSALTSAKSIYIHGPVGALELPSLNYTDFLHICDNVNIALEELKYIDTVEIFSEHVSVISENPIKVETILVSQRADANTEVSFPANTTTNTLKINANGNSNVEIKGVTRSGTVTLADRKNIEGYAVVTLNDLISTGNLTVRTDYAIDIIASNLTKVDRYLNTFGSKGLCNFPSLLSITLYGNFSGYTPSLMDLHLFESIEGTLYVSGYLSKSVVDFHKRMYPKMEIIQSAKYESAYTEDESIVFSRIGVGDFHKRAVLLKLKRAIESAGIQVTILSDMEARDSLSESTTLKLPDGTIYGFVRDGVIVLIEENMDPETLIHEYTHLWVNTIKHANPTLWKDIKKLLTKALNSEKNEEILQYAKDRKIRIRLGELQTAVKGLDPYEEMIAYYSGIYNERVIEEKTASDTTLEDISKSFDYIKEALSKLWNWLKEFLTLSKSLNNITDVTNLVLSDLLQSRKLIRHKEVSGFLSKMRHKRKESELSAEDKSKLEKQKIRNFRINKLEYSNLSLEDLQYLEERGISKEEYNSLDMLEREIVMKCR